MKTLYNPTYVIRERSHIGLTICVIGPELFEDTGPLKPEIHDILGKLEAITDIHFLMLPGLPIVSRKFAEAYQAVSWSDSGQSEIQGILGAIRYDRELYPGQHIAWFLADMTDLDLPETVRKATESLAVLRKSVVNIERLGPHELWLNYSGTPKKSGWSWKVWDMNPDAPDYGLYDTHTATGTMVFRETYIKKLEVYLGENPGYLGPYCTNFDILRIFYQYLPVP